jgi:beta-glucosidase
MPGRRYRYVLGSETGHAIADVLFGKVAPSGRLPISFPYESGQQPFYYAHKSTGRPSPAGPAQPYKARYQTVPNEARFPFGHGLTYSRIEYAAPQAGDGQLGWNGTLELSAVVRNVGKRSADEVVQLYIHDRAASITRPVRQLIGFRKVRLQPGAQQRVQFAITRADLQFIGRELVPTVEPGIFDFWIAPSSASGTPGQFTLLSR